MSDFNEVSRAIGSLEAKVENLTSAVRTLTGTVEGLQKSRWMAKGAALVVAALSGAGGAKLAALLGIAPPGGHP